jgi:hypothetical protein
VSKSSASTKRNYAGFAAFVFIFAVAIVSAALLVISPARRGSVKGSPVFQAATKQARPNVQVSFATLPLAFEQNQGQTDAQVKYMARARGYQLFLTNNDALFSLHSKSFQPGVAARRTPRTLELNSKGSRNQDVDSFSTVRMELVNGSSSAAVIASEPLPGKSNYYIGNDPKNWHTGVSQYARVAYKNVYPGVDLAYYGEQNKLEFDFIVAPNSSPSSIGFAFSGAQRLATSPSGDLVVSSAAGDIVLHNPVAYQKQGGIRQPVDAQFVLAAHHQVRFQLGPYDRSRELIIDPSVTYATYLGGSAEDDAYAIGFDANGSAYLTGQTESTDFPIVGGYSGTNVGNFDVFVTKINAKGDSLIYSTYIGGSRDDSGNALAVDSSGDVFVAGGTASPDFPTPIKGSYQRSFGGGTLNAFVFELKPGGSIFVFSTYLGGTGMDYANGIAIDATGTYVVGSASSVDFPTTPTAFQPDIAGTSNGFVTKLDPTGATLLYSTYLGGSGDFASAVAVSSSQAYVTGATQNPAPTFPSTPGAFQSTCDSCSPTSPDAFVTAFNSAGTGLVYSTFLGGSGADGGLGIAVDSSGDAYVTGITQSADFPTQSPWQKALGGSTQNLTQNAFVTELNPTGSALTYSTYLGGNTSDGGSSIAVDANKNAYVTGQAESPNFPLSQPTQGTLGGGNDAFVSLFNSSGSLFFSTYLGGSQNENTAVSGSTAPLGAIAADGNGNVYVTGNTFSTDFPTAAAAGTSVYQTSCTSCSLSTPLPDAFIAKYSVPSTADFSVTATTPAAVSPGSSGTSTVTLLSINGYSSPVNLTCSVTGTGSPLPACSGTSSFSPNPATPTATGATSTLTVTTTGSSSAMIRPAKFLYAMWLPVAGLSLIGMGFGSPGARRKKVFGWLMIGIAMSMLLLLPACGGGSSGGGGNVGTATPAGSYTVTVTATGTDSATTTHTTTLTLTVN